MVGLRQLAPNGVKILPLGQTFTVGRDAHNDLSLPDDGHVSSKHARIRRVGDAYVVEDIGSRNGTFLERKHDVVRVTEPQPLEAGDIIRVGSARLAFDPEAAPGVQDAERAGPAVQPERPGASTQVFGKTKRGRVIPIMREPQPDQPAAPAPTALQDALQRIAELERRVAGLEAQLERMKSQPSAE